MALKGTATFGGFKILVNHRLYSESLPRESNSPVKSSGCPRTSFLHSRGNRAHRSSYILSSAYRTKTYCAFFSQFLKCTSHEDVVKATSIIMAACDKNAPGVTYAYIYIYSRVSVGDCNLTDGYSAKII